VRADEHRGRLALVRLLRHYEARISGARMMIAALCNLLACSQAYQY
jgi:hypothetical protein